MTTIEERESIFQKKKYIPFLAILPVLLWGSSFPTVKIGYRLFEIEHNDVPAFLLFAGIRFVAAGLLTVILASILLKRFVRPKKSVWPELCVTGLMQTGMQYIFFYPGLSVTSGAKASILGATGAFFTVSCAWFFNRSDRMTGGKFLGCILGFIGVVLVNLNGLVLEEPFRFTGEGFLILSAFGFGVGSLVSKKATVKENPFIVSGYQLLIGGGVLLLSGIFTGGRLPVVNTPGILVLSYLIFLSTIAFTLWTLLLQKNDGSKIGVYYFLLPVFGVTLSALFLGENPWNIQLLGALACVSIGIYIINLLQGKRSHND